MKRDEGLKEGDYVLVQYKGVGHFGIVKKRFRTRVRVETRMKKQARVPLPNGSWMTKPVTLNLMRSVDKVQKVPTEEPQTQGNIVVEGSL